MHPLQAEFDAEQEYLKTLSYLSADEQRRYRWAAPAGHMGGWASPAS